MTERCDAPLPPVTGLIPPELAVVRHSVGYTEVVLANGDCIRCHLFIQRFTFDENTFSYSPEFRVVPEYRLAELRCEIGGILQGTWRC